MQIYLLERIGNAAPPILCRSVEENLRWWSGEPPSERDSNNDDENRDVKPTHGSGNTSYSSVT